MRITSATLAISVTFAFAIDLSASEAHEIYAYAGYNETKAEKLELVGQIIDKGQRMSHEPRKSLGFDIRDTIVTARLFRSDNLRVGDEIFIIQKSSEHSKYKHGLIVSKAEVLSIFRTEFSGMMITARGQFAMVKKNYYVARRSPAARLEALVTLKQADKMRHTGNAPEALALYRKSADEDKTRPETSFALARFYLKQGNTIEADNYLKSAWKHKTKFEDAQDMLSIGGLYFGRALANVHARNIEKLPKLKEIIKLLDEHRKYLKDLASYKLYFAKDSFRVGKFQTLPDFEYQLQTGRLYETAAILLRNLNPDKVTESLSKDEKVLLFAPVFADVKSSQPLFPRKIWDAAYEQAALFHFEIAHKINRLDTRAAYAIIDMADRALAENMSANRREHYAGLIQYYSAEFLSIPSDERLMARVRNVVKSASHLW